MFSSSGDVALRHVVWWTWWGWADRWTWWSQRSCPTLMVLCFYDSLYTSERTQGQASPLPTYTQQVVVLPSSSGSLEPLTPSPQPMAPAAGAEPRGRHTSHYLSSFFISPPFRNLQLKLIHKLQLGVSCYK